MITPALLKVAAPGLDDDVAEMLAPKLQAACTKFGLKTKREVAHLLAQLGHESNLRPVEENLNYSAKRLVQVWPNRFNAALAAACAGKPEKIANVVYANRMGNGSPESGEGFKYRGRGFIQLTGKANYEKYGDLIGYDLVKEPDLLLQYGIGSLVACAFFVQTGCAVRARQGGLEMVDDITRIINGGYNGLDDRKLRYVRLAKYLGC